MNTWQNWHPNSRGRALETDITVRKLNEKGQETWRYQGQLLEHEDDQIILQAFFDRQDTHVAGMTLAKGDRFLEFWYRERWYNFFEIHAREDDHLRGWYCNIGYVQDFTEQEISYIDLALDLLVFPNGRQVVLDEDEFATLEISPQVRSKALAALTDLRESFRQDHPSFLR
jgi:protein associated with RNAse G/E